MRTIPLAFAAIVLAGACAGGDAANPPMLWLALDGSEMRVRLVDVEPDPF